MSAKQTDNCSQRDKSRADPSENDAEHRMGQSSQSNQQVLMEDNWLSDHNSSADLSLKLYATLYGEKKGRGTERFKALQAENSSRTERG